MEKTVVKFGDWIEEGFNLYKANFQVLVLAAVIGFFISAVTVGILAGPMLAGMVLICLQLIDRISPAPGAGVVFKGFDYFLNSLLYFIIWGIAILAVSAILAVIPVIGQFLSFFAAYAAQTFLMFGLFLIVDKKMNFGPASEESIKVVKTNFWPFFGFSLISGIIGGLGALICGIGIIFTLPIQVCMLTAAYRDVFTPRHGEKI